MVTRMEVMLTVLLTGFLTCMALIVAIGPQGAWLLRQGLRRDRVALAIACCLIGDALLITLGTLGVGAILDHAPWLLDVIRWAGVAYLVWFAYRSFRSAFSAGQNKDLLSTATSPTALTQRAPKHQASPQKDTVRVAMTSQLPQVPPASETSTTTTARQNITVTNVSKVTTVAATGLTLSILNPHAWVDSLVVLGAMANSFGPDKWYFAAGAMLASVIWLTALALGCAALAKLLNRPRTWQVIDALVGLIMLGVAAILALNGFS